MPLISFLNWCNPIHSLACFARRAAVKGRAARRAKHARLGISHSVPGLVHWLILTRPLFHSLTHSLVHPGLFIDAFIDAPWFVHSFIHSFIHSFVHGSIPCLIPCSRFHSPLIHPLILVYCFTLSSRWEPDLTHLITYVISLITYVIMWFGAWLNHSNDLTIIMVR